MEIVHLSLCKSILELSLLQRDLRTDLAVASVPTRTLAHVQLARVVVVGGVDARPARVEQRRVERVAVPLAPDLGLPGLRALRLVGVRHVPGEDGARPQAADAPVVAEGLAVGVALPAAAVEVVGAVPVKVAAEAAQTGAELGGDAQLEEAHAVPQQTDT